MAAEFDSGLFVNANLRKEWHGLGQIVPTVPRSTQEAMQMAGMDWRVMESPVITIGDGDDAEPSLVEGWKCLRHYDQLVANFESGVGATLPGVRGTAWAAYNAVTEWTSHQRGKDDVDAARKRLNNLWFGTGGKINQVAHQAALSLV